MNASQSLSSLSLPLPDILANIIATKHDEVKRLKQRYNVSDLLEIGLSNSPSRGFALALTQNIDCKRSAVIAEIKQASPSKGVLRSPFEPALIAQQYEQGGATCLSVLTDELYFKGCNDYLKQARLACGLPVIRKEFIIDEHQLYEAKAIGADAVLLIAACLSSAQLKDFEALATELNIDVLVEVHDKSELLRVLNLDLNTPLIGINNRNLRTFEVNLKTTLDLLPLIDSQSVPKKVITESGILTVDDVALMHSHNVYGFLVGEVFMRSPNPSEALQALFK
jgi:indole-3-glycerol phosphate synthase